MKIGLFEKKTVAFVLVILFCIGIFGWGVSEAGKTNMDWTHGLFGGGLIAAAVAVFLVSLTVYRRK